MAVCLTIAPDRRGSQRAPKQQEVTKRKRLKKILRDGAKSVDPLLATK